MSGRDRARAGPASTTSLLSEGSGKTRPQDAGGAANAWQAEGETKRCPQTRLLKKKSTPQNQTPASNTSSAPRPGRRSFRLVRNSRTARGPGGGPPAPALTNEQRPRPLARSAAAARPRPSSGAVPDGKCSPRLPANSRRGLHLPAGTAPASGREPVFGRAGRRRFGPGLLMFGSERPLSGWCCAAVTPAWETGCRWQASR